MSAPLSATRTSLVDTTGSDRNIDSQHGQKRRRISTGLENATPQAENEQDLFQTAQAGQYHGNSSDAAIQQPTQTATWPGLQGFQQEMHNPIFPMTLPYNPPTSQMTQSPFTSAPFNPQRLQYRQEPAFSLNDLSLTSYPQFGPVGSSTFFQPDGNYIAPGPLQQTYRPTIPCPSSTPCSYTPEWPQPNMDIPWNEYIVASSNQRAEQAVHSGTIQSNFGTFHAQPQQYPPLDSSSGQGLSSELDFDAFNCNGVAVEHCNTGCDHVDDTEEVACDVECEGEECDSCDGKPTCCEPCPNPEECPSLDCDDPICFDESFDTICTDPHWLSRSPSLTGTIDPQKLLSCEWMETEQCTAKVGSAEELKQHVQTHHIEPQGLTSCRWLDCFDSILIDELPSHITENHKAVPSDSLTCQWNDCQSSFDSDRELQDHVRSDHCGVACHWNGCEKSLTGETALKEHFDVSHVPADISFQSESPPSEKIETPDGQSALPIDYSLSPTLEKSSQDLQIIEPETPSKRNAGPKTCRWSNFDGICGAILPDGNALQRHVENDHLDELRGTGSHICRWHDCMNKNVFSGHSKLARHLYIHTRFKVDECRFCGKEFNNRTQLTNHERMHTQEKPFACDMCDFKAASQANLKLHERMHLGDKPLKCEHCDYQCSDPSNMSKHRKKHGEPEYPCPACGQKFKRNESLKRHLVSHRRCAHILKMRGDEEFVNLLEV